MTDHDDFQGLAAGYALHALEPEDEQRLAAHLLGCQSCARLVADTAAIGAAFASLVDVKAETPPPAGLRERILAAAAAEPRKVIPPAVRRELIQQVPPAVTSGPDAGRPVVRAANGVVPQGSRARRFRVRSRIAVGALAAVVGIGVAIPVTLAASHGGKASSSTSALAQWLLESDARELTLHGTGASAAAKAVVTNHGVLLVASGMPINDRKRSTYVLWASDSHGLRTAIATFDVKNGTPLQVTSSQLPVPAAQVTQIAVSFEPGRTAPKAPSDVLMSGTAA